MKSYDHKTIEKKWQKLWEEAGIYRAKDEEKDNFYVLVEYPYPSGNLHIGHWHAFAVPDIFARKKRMEGKNVLFPMGFDSFGLPAENAAIKHNVNPKEWTNKNIETMTAQLQSMGNSFDWSRLVAASDPSYYKWTQWLFIKLFEKGLAYRKKASVNWCDQCKTVLANEQVINESCERCKNKVIKKEMMQWFLKITDYAERLIDDLDDLDWPEEIKESQKNWIGKSEGALLSFPIKGSNEKIDVFTTRPDTLFGVTYVVLAPENELINTLKEQIENFQDIEKYIEEAKSKDDIDRTSLSKEKTGVELTGIKAIHPITKEELPVYTADYVLASYGTGAVMAVPAHDERDFDFAKKFNLPVKDVIAPALIDKKNPPVEGKRSVARKNVHAIVENPITGKFLGLKWKKHDWVTFPMGGVEDGEDIIEAARREVLEETGYKNLKFKKVLGEAVSAEYFAAHKDENRIALTQAVYFELMDDGQQGISEEELAAHEPFWMTEDELGLGKMAHAEIDIWLKRMRGESEVYPEEGITINSGEFDGLSSEEAKEKITKAAGGEMKTIYKLRDWSVGRQRYWGCPIPLVYDKDGNPVPIPEEHLPWKLPEDVDFKPTGVAPLARSKELKKRTEDIFGKGFTPEVETLDTFVDSSWYFLRYLDPQNENNFSDIEKQKKWMPIDRYSGGAEHTTMHLLYSRFFYKALYDLGLVTEKEPYRRRMNRGIILGPDGQKMSKSRGNVIDPDENVERVGSDTVKMYLAFIGPYNEVGHYPWDLGGISGIRRFLERVWRLKDKVSDNQNEELLQSEIHKAIKKVGEDIEAFKFNTAISTLMVLVNEMEKLDKVSRSSYETFIKILAPFAPHLTEEIWHELGNNGFVHQESWPVYDEKLTQNKEVTLGVQVNGKVRGQITLSPEASQEEALKEALEQSNIKDKVGESGIKKVIYVPGRILNILIN